MGSMPKPKGTQLSTKSGKCTTDNPQSTNSAPNPKKATNRTNSRLTIRQKEFVKNISNIDNPTTFGNALQSYKAAHPGVTNNTAGVEGHRSLNNPKIQHALEQVFAEHGLDTKVLAHTLGRIVRGEYRSSSVTYDKAGKVITSTESSPKPADIVKAGNLYFKSIGVYDINRAAVDLQKDKEFMRLSDKVWGEANQAEGEGGD